MKHCRQCNQVYSDDTLNFCLADGAALVLQSNTSDETIVMGPALVSTPSTPTGRGVNPTFAYLAIGLLALVAGGAIVALLLSRSPSPLNANAQMLDTTSSSNANNFVRNPGKAEPSMLAAANNGGGIVQYPDSRPPPLTSDAVQNLISSWERAQNGKNFGAYQVCYDPSFSGVKTIKSGQAQNYDFQSWIADRRRMLNVAINLNVSHANLQIQVNGDTALVRFDQYYRSLRYSDWGPKEMTVKMTPSGPKIVREELKASYPL